MEFQIEMKYDLNAMTAMSKGIRKALRKEYHQKNTIISCLFAGGSVGILLTSPFFGFQQIITVIALALWVLCVVFQDHVHGIWVRMKRPSNMKKCTWTFREDGFSAPQRVISEFDYDSIYAMIECDGYLILCFLGSIEQEFDLKHMTDVSAADLCIFLQKKTGLTIQKV